MKYSEKRNFAMRYLVALFSVGVVLIVSGVCILSGNSKEWTNREGSISRIHANERVSSSNNLYRDVGAIPKYLEVSSIGISAPVGVGYSYMSENPFSGTEILSFPVPETVTDVTWWADGSGLEGFGMAVFLGHSTAAGDRGVFDHLHELVEGDLINFTSTGDVNFGYVVTEVVDDIDKSNPEALKVELEKRSFKHSVALITCSGEFDSIKRESVQNTIIFADFHEG